ncbi:arylsulfotransferase family protein [Aquimarina sp. MMG016]|uniref:arylsulfotransferase family protein n=1 Tax=Aquimarina sp. MMG016 TaxID=2822690 RepID=UPI001B3A554F|nr:arylsulfotransferase family protein [Aquimarina sp. MMG016]MBQ4821781.1 aryl-sulfate sulfotransferase [Aquimarina sp. MMG016]
MSSTLNFKRLNLIRFSYLKIIFLLLIASITISCSNDDDNAIIKNPVFSFKISSGDLIPEFDKSITDYFVSSLNTLSDISITFERSNSSPSIFVNGNIVENFEAIINLENGQDIIISTLDDEGKIINYTLHYIPQDLPKANVIASNNPSEGYIFVNYYEFSLASGFKDHTYIAILDNSGFPVYYNKVPHPRVGNFDYHKIGNNQKRFSYTINDDEVVVMNENFEEIKRAMLLPNNGHGAYPADNHDFIYFSDDHYIIPAYVTRENVDMTAYGGIEKVSLIDFVFQEIKNNEVIFEWNSADYPEIFDSVSPVFQNQFNTLGPVDYFHFNSFSIDPSDNHFIVSARHTDQLYKIHRTSGEIIWKLGGSNSNFILNEQEIFSHQHHANISKDGTLLLFDNNVTQNQKTRILEYKIDQNNFDIDIIKEYHQDGLFMNIMGSVQKLNNNNFFIGWGGHTSSQIQANKSDIIEIDSQGNILLDINFTNDSEKFTYSYRALKYNIDF